MQKFEGMEKGAIDVPKANMADDDTTRDSQMNVFDKKDESYQFADVEKAITNVEREDEKLISVEKISDEIVDDAIDHAANDGTDDVASSKIEGETPVPCQRGDSQEKALEEAESAGVSMVAEAHSENDAPIVIPPGFQLFQYKKPPGVPVAIIDLVDDEDDAKYLRQLSLLRKVLKNRIVKTHLNKRGPTPSDTRDGSKAKRPRTSTIETRSITRARKQLPKVSTSKTEVVDEKDMHAGALAGKMEDPEKPKESSESSDSIEPSRVEEPVRDSGGTQLDDEMKDKADVEKATEEEVYDDKEGDNSQ